MYYISMEILIIGTNHGTLTKQVSRKLYLLYIYLPEEQAKGDIGKAKSPDMIRGRDLKKNKIQNRTYPLLGDIQL